MRTTQYIGLSEGASLLVEDARSEEYDHTYGMFDEELPLLRFTLPDGTILLEKVEYEFWSSGPMIYTNLYFENGTPHPQADWQPGEDVELDLNVFGIRPQLSPEACPRCSTSYSEVWHKICDRHPDYITMRIKSVLPDELGLNPDAIAYRLTSEIWDKEPTLITVESLDRAYAILWPHPRLLNISALAALLDRLLVGKTVNELGILST